MKLSEEMLSKVPDELKEKVKAATSADELIALSKESGFELSDDQLNAISGGFCWDCSSDSCKEYESPGG